MDLSVITVTWNSEERIIKQIQSVCAGCKEISFEQIVVDNASVDRTVEVIHDHYPEITLIKNLKNEGFSFSNNLGAKLAQGEFVLFLNPDMKIEEEGLDKVINWMKKNKEIGIGSCKLVDECGKYLENAKPRRFPKTWEMIVVQLKINHLIPSLLNRYLYKDFDPGREQDVDSVRGSFMIMRREIIDKIGWAFDPRYFLWFEDVDACREAKNLSYKIIYTPITTCIDYYGQSFNKKDMLWKQKEFTRSMIKYFKKWEPWYKWILIMMIRPLGISLTWGYSRYFLNSKSE
jgi:GT2 family glycosyltransferase